MNEFKEGLQVNPDHLLENSELKKAREEAISKETSSYKELYDNPDYREYFKYLMATIMFYQNKRYPSYGVSMTSRFKASQSISNKVRKRYIEADKSYDETGEKLLGVDIRPFADAFAIKFISESMPPLFYSTYPHISELIEKRDKNQAFLKDMQIFKSKLIYDDFRDREDYKPRPNVPKIDYYNNSKKLLEKLLDLVDSEEIELRKSYQAKIMDIDNRLKLLKASHLENSSKGMVDEKDISTNNKIDFFALLTDFEERYSNEAEIQNATMQFLSLFETNPIFEKLGVSIDYSKLEEKRAKTGYESNFIVLNTPLGPVECQIQTDSQRRYGSYGGGAHTKLEGKAIEPVEIPDANSEEELKRFIEQINEISPRYYEVNMDPNEQGRVMVKQLSDYQNYKAVTSQVDKSDPIEEIIYLHFERLSELTDTEAFKNAEITHELTEGFTQIDIEKYANSEKLQKLKEEAIERKQNSEEPEK